MIPQIWLTHRYFFSFDVVEVENVTLGKVTEGKLQSRWAIAELSYNEKAEACSWETSRDPGH